MDADLRSLDELAEGIEAQVRELRERIAELADVEPAPAGPPVADSGPDDSEARIVAYSMVLDGRPRDEVAKHLADELGLTDSGALLDDLYSRAAS